jgi:Rieske Fe-S protein
MTNSTVSSMIIRDLIINGDSKWKDAYNPSRKDIVASAKNFVVQNINVADMLVCGKTSPKPGDITVNEDEAQVIKTDGQITGSYKDNNGELHLVNTTCTHMGCELAWNSAEKTWDCPCHGSRFKYEGGIVKGPAISPLSFDKDVNTVEKLIKDDF